MKRFVYLFFAVFFLTLCPAKVQSWGFFGHKLINRNAVFTLPPEMIGFFKKHIVYLTENSVNPDRRRYAVVGEAPRHYIDLENYGDSAVYKVPRQWDDAVRKFGEDSLMAHGIGPWNVYRVFNQLTRAFERKDAAAILRFAADLGHYIGDINVPLHTTVNYNGQLSNQHGIHGFWESRLPELFSGEYNFFVGKAAYVSDPHSYIWEAVAQAHAALDSVLLFEKELSIRMGQNRKFSFEDRGQQTIRVYSRNFSKAYHDMLSGQVERQMRKSIKMLGDFWYTAWVNAGQPNLMELAGIDLDPKIIAQWEREAAEWEKGNIKVREHDY
jgi:hypothetical protein